MNLLKQLKDKVLSWDKRSQKALINIFKSFLFKGGNMMINLVLVPLTIGFVNPEEYGIWLTISSIIAWFSISDIGFGNGLRNKFTEAVALGDIDLARSYVSTTYIALSVLIFFMWLIFIISNFFVDWSIILNTGVSLKSELSMTMMLLFTFFSLQFVLKLVGTLLTANQEPGKNAGLVFFSNVLLLAGILGLKKLVTNGSLVDLAWVTGISQVMVFLIASIFYYNGELRPYRPSIKLFEYKHVNSLMNLGLKFFIIQISMIFIFQSTNIIIVQILGPEQVTVYNISYKLFTIPMTIAMIIASPFWSAFTDAYAKKDFIWMRKIFKYLTFFNIFICTILVGLLMYSEEIYNIWLGSKIKIPFQISLLMMLNVVFATTFNLYIFIINGIGKLSFQIKLNIALSIIYIPLSIFLGRNYGLNGIIFANLIINLILGITIPFQSWALVNNRSDSLIIKT